jgi:hypothetical protein
MNKSDIYRLADDLREEAGRLAYPEVLENADSGVSLGDQGQLWKEHKDRAGYHQLHVRPIHFIQAAKSTLRGIPLGFLKNVHSWKEVEAMYRAMYASSINPKSGYDSETAQDLEIVANALKVAADGLQNHQNYKRNEPDTFDGWKNYFFCPFCWRLAPRVKRKQEKPGRCSVHEDVQSPATRRARRLRDYIAPEYRALPHAKIKNAFNIEFKKTKIYTAPFHHIKSIIHSDIYNQVMYPSPSFDPAVVPIEKMSTKRIWSFFPHAAEYAYQHGADLNNLYSAVKALDDDVDPTGMRERIHIAYSRAPILAEDFLLNAEVWLHLETQKRWRGKQRIHS